MSSVEIGYVHMVQTETKRVKKNGVPEDVALASLRVHVDRSRRVGEDQAGKPVYNNDRGFWINVELWGPKAKHLEATISKGATIMMVGRYDNNTWTDKESGEARTQLVFVADEIAILPRCIESVQFKQKKVAAKSENGTEAEAGG